MRNRFIKPLVLLMIVAILLWLNQTYLQITPEQLRQWIVATGWYAPLIYFVLYNLRTLILFPPSILSLAGGLAFGPIYGTVLTVLSATSSAVLSFVVARKWGKNIFTVPMTGKVEFLQQKLEQHGFTYVLLIRLIPFIPFDLVSYLSGVSRLRFRAFFWGSLFGIIPGTFAYNLLGSSFASGHWQDWLVAGIVFGVSILIPLFFRKWLERSTRS